MNHGTNVGNGLQTIFSKSLGGRVESSISFTILTYFYRERNWINGLMDTDDRGIYTFYNLSIQKIFPGIEIDHIGGHRLRVGSLIPETRSLEQLKSFLF